MNRSKDIRPIAAELYFLPAHTRMPLKFGAETVSYVTCARCRLTVKGRNGRTATGWGETPLSVTWVWPSSLPYEERHEALKSFCQRLVDEWATFDCWGHPIEIGHDFISSRLSAVQHLQQEHTNLSEPLPWLAALVGCSVFDQALHDAYGNLHEIDVYQTYNRNWMNRALGDFLAPATERISFADRYPTDYLVSQVPTQLAAWHLVGGADPIDESELTGNEPNDGYPVLLRDWIEQDALRCLKVKLRGNDRE